MQPIVEELLRGNLHDSDPHRGIEIAMRRKGRLLEITLGIRKNGDVPQAFMEDASKGVFDIAKERLSRLYDAHQDLSIDTTPEGWGVVRMKIPFKETSSANTSSGEETT